MSALVKEKLYTPNDYLALEDEAKYRSEYVNGLIYQMAGGKVQHIDITFNVTAKINEKLRGKCRAYASELKVWADEANTFFYPDITVVCGERDFYKNRQDIVTNPILLIEVLSKSTEAKDRGEKFFAYQALESLEEYILVSHDKYLIEQFTRQNDGSWKYLATIGIDSEVTFESLNTTLKLKDIYDLVEFEEENN
jgi:Uma2 family endonuclease